MAQFDMKKLDTSDKIVAGASVITLICLFLPWYGVSAGPYSASVSGFSTSYGWLGALLIIAAGVYLVMLRSGSNMPKNQFGPGVTRIGPLSSRHGHRLDSLADHSQGRLRRLQLRPPVRDVHHDPRRHRSGGLGVPSLQEFGRESAVGGEQARRNFDRHSTLIIGLLITRFEERRNDPSVLMLSRWNDPSISSPRFPGLSRLEVFAPGDHAAGDACAERFVDSDHRSVEH
jgi:hypothetical protein